MRRSVVIVLVLAAAAVAAGASRSGSGAPPAGVFADGPPVPRLLGIVPERRRQRLVRVDPDTLRARTRRSVNLGSAGCAPRSGGQACFGVSPWSFSPDRSRLAAARHEGGVVRSLRLVDVARLRVAADIPIGGDGAVGLVAWPARARLLAVQEICCDGRQQLLVVDAGERRVTARHPLGGTVERVGRTARELVLLIAPPDRIGPARLAVVDGRGSVRFAALELHAGERPLDGVDHGFEHRSPGLAIDPAARRAFVVEPGRAAAVDLATLAVSHHELTPARSLAARLRDWLVPAAHAKTVTGPLRSAQWLGGGRLAVTGLDGDHPAGLSVVDTRDWSIRAIDDDSAEVRIAGGLLLATGGHGLTAYDFDGDERFALRDGAWVEEVHDGRAYVGVRSGGVRMVDLATGRQTGERTTSPPRLLLEPAASWWDF